MILNINGLFLRYLSAGLGKYSFQLIKHLNKDNKNINLYIPIDANISDKTIKSLGNICINNHSTIKKTGNEFIDTKLWERSFYRKIKSERDSILFSPYFMCSPYSIGNEVVTVGDVIQYLFPQYVTSIPRYLSNIYNKQYIKRVKNIITFSEYSKRDIVRHLQCKPEYVFPIYPGVSDLYRPISDRSRIENIRTKYKLPDKFILYLGGYDYRKNVLLLLQAFKEIKNRSYAKEIHLVLAGEILPKTKNIVPDIKGALRDMNLERSVCCTGYIPEEDLPYIFNMAKVFVYPSFYEGFGLPVLEAMACGTPIISSNATSIPEIVNREDILFNANSITDLTNIMNELLKDQEYRNDVSKWGRNRAACFTWEDTARQTESIFNSIE